MSVLADTVVEKMRPHTRKHEHPYFSAEWAHKWLQKENHTWQKPQQKIPKRNCKKIKSRARGWRNFSHHF